MKSTIAGVILIFVFGILACDNRSKSVSETQNTDSIVTKNTKDMNSYISIFEIPATDIVRASTFYQEILGVKIERMDFPGLQMGLFPYEEQLVAGVIMKGEDYRPSAGGVTIYLNGGDNLQIVLDKVEKNGGKVIVPKTPHADEVGYFAIFHDSEGNRIGLHSSN
jgi:predicted enzyme related to lactoylglutathione lyase